MPQPRLLYLDLVRVLAFALVVLQHVALLYEDDAAMAGVVATLRYLTEPCVPLFFMVSGALVLPCAEDERFGPYLRRRLARILVPALVFTLFYIGLRRWHVGWDGITAQLLSIPFSAQQNGSLWFVYALAGLYMLVPLLSPWLRRASRGQLQFYLVLWAVTLVLPELGRWLRVDATPQGMLYYFAGYGGYFLLGHYLRRYPPRLAAWLVPGLLALALPLLAPSAALLRELSLPTLLMSVLWFQLPRLLAPPPAASDGRRPPQPRIARWAAQLSRLTFTAYLLHVFVIYSLLWNRAPLQALAPATLQLATLFLLATTAAYALAALLSLLPKSRPLLGT